MDRKAEGFNVKVRIFKGLKTASPKDVLFDDFYEDLINTENVGTDVQITLVGRLDQGRFITFAVSAKSLKSAVAGELIEIPITVAHTSDSTKKWLFDNPEALASVKCGISDAKAGRVKSLGSFAKFVDEDEES